MAHGGDVFGVLMVMVMRPEIIPFGPRGRRRGRGPVKWRAKMAAAPGQPGRSSPSPTGPPQQAATVTLHITTLAGGNALSTFRAQQLQPALEAIHPKITGHCRALRAPGGHRCRAPAAEQERLAALLTYGDPYEGPQAGAAMVVTRAWARCRPGPQGHRHRAQLRHRHPPRRAHHRIPHQPEIGPAGQTPS